MNLRVPLHLLALIGLLVAFSAQTARSQPNHQAASSAATRQNQPIANRAIATSAGIPAQAGAPSQNRIAATAALSNTVYLSSVMRMAPQLDLSIDSLEITQAVQTSSNNVPLVAGRPAIVRVYAKYTGTAVPDDVTVTLTGTRAGVALTPVTLGPQAVSTSPSRASYSSSFNLSLPSDWLSGTVAMTATVDPTAAVAEADETNNAKTATLVFHTVPALNLVIVPIRYTDLSNGKTYAPPTADTISDFVKRTYPLSTINVTFHAPFNFTGDLGDLTGYYWGNYDNTGLLDKVTTLKSSEVGINSPKVYYGLVSTGTSPSDTWLPLNSGFILGIGWISTRASAGLDIPSSFGLSDPDITSDTAAHEIGHNLGRYHAPCDTSSGLDPNYPNSTASIVQFGVDVSKGVVLSPSTTKDVMSYCSPQWISDYTYKALYTALGGTAVARSAAPVDSLLIRGGIGPDGSASLAPAYGITGVPDAAPDTSGYRLEFLDAAGNVVASQPVAVSEMEQPHVVALAQNRLVPQTSALAARVSIPRAPRLAINAIVAAPAQAYASMRLVRASTVLATRTLRSVSPATAAAAPSVERQADGTLLLRWNATSGPALVRYTADDGATWATLGVDLLSGELSIDPATLPAGPGYIEITPADGGAPATRVAVP
jgi:hypothetical protein